MVCAIGKEDGTILEQISIPTTTPQETIPKLIGYFKDKNIEALGIVVPAMLPCLMLVWG